MRGGSVFLGLFLVQCVIGESLVHMSDNDPVMTSQSSAESWNSTLFWGAYRPNVYFGTRTRSPQEFLTGIMWHKISQEPRHFEQMRHTCEMGDGLKQYEWTMHDGTSFGVEEIVDPKNDLHLSISFVKQQGGKNGGDWVARLKGSSTASRSTPIALYFYVAADPDASPSKEEEIFDLTAKGHHKGLNTLELHGKTTDLGEFSIVIKEGAENRAAPSYSNAEKHVAKLLPDLQKIHFLGTSTPSNEIWRVKDITLLDLRQNLYRLGQQVTKALEKNRKADDKTPIHTKEFPSPFVPTLSNSVEEDSNVYVFQKILQPPFELDIVFVSHSAHASATKTKKKKIVEEALKTLTREKLTEEITKRSTDFEERFEAVFGLSQKGYNKDQQKFAMAAFSSLLGGVGYFHGNWLVHQQNSLRPLEMPPASLYSAVPCRPFFPRGFLWDEGFHQMLISKFDTRITMDVLKHWFNLMDSNGWIPREQILGYEARSKVPPEFQVQHKLHANPPTLLLVLDSIRETIIAAKSDIHTLEDYTAFLKEIFPKAQKWYGWFESTQNGIVEDTFRWRGRTENHTLASGLDDYPRARKPSVADIHLDLMCWMTKGAKILRDIAALIDDTNSRDTYSSKYHAYLSKIEELTWNGEMYTDVTFTETGKEHEVHVGYVNLFPLLLGLIPADSPRLEALLRVLKDPQQLWSPFGIRSLSLADKEFGTGENYWKGPIWINMNYLILSSLHKHYINEGPYKEQAKNIYTSLRKNVVDNMFNNYKSTGFIWEQYNPLDGKGQRSYPFTGWSSLVVAIMAEQY